MFDPFPFPDPDDALKVELRAAGEELDAFRKARQAEYPRLTLTQMYNVRERIRAIERAAGQSPPLIGEGAVSVSEPSGAGSMSKVTPHPAAPQPPSPARGEGSGTLPPPLTPEEERIKEEGLILVLNELHDRIDRLTLAAYGWPEGLSDEAILERLVALNKERAAEERRGIVRWLRPEYQKGRAGVVEIKPEQTEAELVAPAAKAALPAFPKDAVEQSAAVAAALAEAREPLTAAAIAARFRRGKRIEARVASILAAFVRTGFAASSDGSTFQARRAA